MARPQLPASSRPTYFGGTPTSAQGYDRPDLADDREYQAQNRPSALDFSDQAIQQRQGVLRQQAIDELQASRQLLAEAGPTGWVAPGAVPEGFQDTTPLARANQAYIAYTIALHGTRASNLQSYPTLAKAAIQANVNESDLARLVNYAEVDRAAERVLGALNLVYNEEGDEAKAGLGQYQVDNILNSANPVMKAAILDVVAEKIKEIEAPGGTDSASWADTVLENAGKILATVFAPFDAANRAVQQTVRASQYGIMQEGNDPLGIEAIQNVFQYWDKVSEGNYDQKLLSSARQEFGTAPVDLVLAVEKKTLEGDPDPLISVMMEQANNPDAMNLLSDMLYGENSTGVNMAEVSRAVDNAALGNTGQLFLTSILGDAGMGSESRAIAANAGNIVATLALDPTLLAGKIRAAYITTRFALEKIAPGASRAGIKSALNMRPTRTYFDGLFNQLNKYDELVQSDPGKAAVLREQIRRQYPEIPDSTIDVFRSDGIRTVDDLVEWTVETNEMFTKLAKGQPATGLITAGESAAPEPLANAIVSRGQAQTRSALLPRTSVARRSRSAFARSISPLMPSRRAQAVIDDVYGGTSDPEQFVETVSDLGNVSRAGAIERAGIESGTPGTLGKKLDTTFKYFSSIGIGHVNIVDGRDAKQVYRYARMFLSRRHAAYWADMWRKANPSQRYDMMIGLNRTAAAAKGLDLADPEMLSRVDELVTATRSKTSFSARSPVLNESSDTVKTALMEERDVLAGLRPDTDGARSALGPDGTLARIRQIDSELAAVQAIDTSIPSQFPDGSEKALFGWQTASHVALPNIRDMEMLGRWQRAVRNTGRIGEVMLAAPQRVTDAWSLGTLFGLRFSLRSAIEDWWFYAVITGGNLKDLYKGRRMSTILRETRGRKRETAFTQQDVPALGMINRRARAVGDMLENRDNFAADILSKFIRGNLDQEDVQAAYQAARRGDFDPMRRLAGVAMASARMTGFSAAEKDYLLDLVDGPFGLKILDELAETGRTLNSGGLVDDAALPIAGTDTVGVSAGALPRTDNGKLVPVGDYTPELPVDPVLPESFLYWERNINGVLLGDGPAGRIAVAYLDDPQEAIRRVADEIREDPTGYGYKWRFAALESESPEMFAARKVQAVRGLFSDAQGNLNEKLWRRVVSPDRTVTAYKEGEDGTRSLIIDAGMLRGLPKEQRPAYVSGQVYGTAPNADGLGAFMDRSWSWMGEQYARISREPIFLANYIAHRRQLAGYQKELSKDLGEKAARRVVSRMAEDRAYSFTLSYMDNPQNRSLLAYKVRNVSRYYRATEDFYRRAMRAGKNYPVGLWKTALIYDVLDDTGFVYTDDNGEKYFLYPGTNQLLAAMNAVMGKVAGQDPMAGAYPFVLGGKVRMLAPSTDPNQLAPTLAGPWGTISWKLLARRFPSLSRLNRVVLGEYGVTGEGSVIDDFTTSFFPGQLQRAINTLSDDEVDSLVAASAKDALTIAVVNDLIPEDENTPEFANAMAKIDLIAWSAVLGRFFTGFVFPASPQQFNANISEFARMNRIVAPRPAFLKLVQKYTDQGEENPVGAALANWWKIDQNLMPFTVSRTQDVGEGVRGTAPMKTAKSVLDWYNNNRTGVIEKYPQTAYFLAPQDEGFDWNTWGLIISEGLRVPKAMLDKNGDPGPFLRDLFAAGGEFQYYATIADYQRDIDALDPRDPDQYSQIKELESQRSIDLEGIRTSNPYLDLKLAENNNWGERDVVAERALTQTKRMVDELFESTPKAEWNGSPAQAIRNAIYTYIDYASEIRMTVGADDDSEMKRRMLRLDLEDDLNGIAEASPNAKLFIRNVLMSDPDIKVLDLELVGATNE